MLRIIILLLAAGSASAQNPLHLRLHESSRVLAMGGAFVAVADDPQAGLHNPAGLKNVGQIGQDLSWSSGTGDSPDQLAASLVNPGTESGASFATGFLMQGVLKGEPVKYYLPYTGMAWTFWDRSGLGMTLRFPYRTSTVDSIKSRWEGIADVSAMVGFGHMSFGGQIERAIGGADDMVPRRLRLGTSLSRPGLYAVAYEWRGGEGDSRYDFHYDSAHLGGELVTRKYFALRGGYVWSETYAISAGMAFGLIQAGWRLETGWQIPTGEHGETRWSVGIGYRG